MSKGRWAAEPPEKRTGATWGSGKGRVVEAAVSGALQPRPVLPHWTAAAPSQQLLSRLCFPWQACSRTGGRGASMQVCTPLSAPLWIPSPSVPLPEPSSKPLSPESRVRKTFRPVFIQSPSQRRRPFSRLILFGGDTCDVRGLTTLQAAQLIASGL